MPGGTAVPECRATEIVIGSEKRTNLSRTLCFYYVIFVSKAQLKRRFTVDFIQTKIKLFLKISMFFFGEKNGSSIFEAIVGTARVF